MANAEVLNRIYREKHVGIDKQANLSFKVPGGSYRKINSPGVVRLQSLLASTDRDGVLEIRTTDDLIERNAIRANQSLNISKLGTTGSLCVVFRNRSAEEANVDIQMVWQLL